MLDSPFFTLFGSITLGVAFGALRWRGLSLGSAGVFFIALVLGHWGSIGSVRVYVPHAVKQLIRELGLVIFLILRLIL